VLSGEASWGDIPSALADHADFLRGFTADQGIQTNEVGRAWTLLPAFLLLAQEAGVGELDLIELGPSAGFNLIWDRYHYRYRAGEWGGPRALLELTGEERRPVPGSLLDARLSVRGRIGIDISPIDVTSEEGALLLKSFVWADQEERLETLDRAIAAVRQAPPKLLQGDYSELLPRLLAERRPGALTVVFQTATRGYLTDEQWQRVESAMDTAAQDSPLGWISSTRPPEEGAIAWGLDVRLLPADPRLVAQADYHGSWLDWIGP
jgi:hypothetical protein